MKKKAGQAPSVRSAEVRSNQLAPVRTSSGANKPAPVRVDASRAPSHAGAIPKGAGTRNVTRSDNPVTKSGSAGSKSAVRATPKRKKAKKKSHAGVVLAVILVILLLAAGGGYGYLYSTGYFKPHIEVTMADGTVSKLMAEDVFAELSQDVDKFYPGTFINDIDVGGMTADQAYEAVNKSLTEATDPVNVNYNLKLDGKVYPLDFSDAKFEYNTREVVNAAIGFHKVTDATDYQKIIECYNYKQSLQTLPEKYETSYTVAIDGVAEKVHAILDPLVEGYSTVKNAEIGEFNPETKEFTITPEQTGMTIDIDGAVEGVKKLFDNQEFSGSVVVPSVPMEPEVTTEKLKANFGLVGEHVTKASDNANRNNNLNQACKYINGTILKPGEEFSFNKVVGQRTVKRGFKEATVIQGGQYEQGLGGGVCQVSSTLYDAVLKSDLKIVKRYPHAWPSDYVLEGLDATVDYPALDFVFKNNSDYQIIILMWFESKDRTVHAQIYGKRFPDEQKIVLRSEIVKQTGMGKTEYVEDRSMAVGKTKTVRQPHHGKTVKTFKIWQDKDGKEIKREVIGTTTYASYGKRIAVGTRKSDGTYAKIDTKTGQVVGSASPTPEGGGNTNTAKPTSSGGGNTNTPTTKTNTNTPTTKPADPTPTTKPADPTPTTKPADPTPGGGGEGGGGEGGGGGGD